MSRKERQRLIVHSIPPHSSGLVNGKFVSIRRVAHALARAKCGVVCWHVRGSIFGS